MRLVSRIKRRLRRQQTKPVPSVADFMNSGKSREEALIRHTRALVEANKTKEAMSFALEVRDSGEPIGHVAVGIVAHNNGDLGFAWDEMRSAPDDLWLLWGPTAFAESGAAIDPADMIEKLRAIRDHDAPARCWLPLTQLSFALGEYELAKVFYDKFAVRAQTKSQKVDRDWLAPWMERRRNNPSAGRINEISFALTDYGHPGRARASANIGDHIQSIASIGHVVRHMNTEFSGPEDLVTLANHLQSRVRPGLQEFGAASKVRLMTIDRDASGYFEVPEDTWMLGFGWFMHPVFEVQYGLPLHENLRPIFVSFHCNRRELLSDEAISYLKQYGPIGCRDWTTVDILLSAGVPAFFSGCITTTVSTVFPESFPKAEGRSPEAWVDVEFPPKRSVVYKHSSDAIKFRSFTQNCFDAIELLETYRARHKKMVTSRLHCYLPARSLGIEVDFRPRNRADIRFAGLFDLNNQQFDEIRFGILDLLQPVMSKILSGAEVDEVYALWRELTAEKVEIARQRHVAEYELPISSPRVAARPGSTVEVVVRGANTSIFEQMRTSLAQHSEIRVSRISEDDVYSLPQMFPDAQRIVVIEAPAIVAVDIRSLAMMELGTHLIAAPSRPTKKEQSGFGRLHAAANRLGAKRERAIEMRRIAHQKHSFDFEAFRSDVLVLDANRLRDTPHLARAQSAARAFGLRLDEALMFEFGPQCQRIEDSWAVIPTKMASEQVKLVHWADQPPPWSDRYTALKTLWPSR